MFNEECKATPTAPWMVVGMSKPRQSATQQTKHNRTNRSDGLTRSMESVILALGSCLATPKAMRGLAARSSTDRNSAYSAKHKH